MTALVVVTRDLMDAGRVRSAVPDAVVVRDAGDAALADADLIVIDLGSGVDPAEVVAIGPPVVAYGPHVDAGALDAAVAAGCRDALPRSVVFRRLAELID